jgi:hypothetical protein
VAVAMTIGVSVGAGVAEGGGVNGMVGARVGPAGVCVAAGARVGAWDGAGVAVAC